ncbi:DUF1614 domain-containing protein [Limnochorda pilosa]|uniref:DUF1614 domain-containing protein n=1 Tax=Limnochorda pilosa TaxID=1555112 RepID=A0A0K2SKK3_LIMPI|nr:DUF1614 domain-containing protein [Limnochorda pilosa]BAS27625.1 hypothetical protein LIP_1781 [Limnochorda pilosa]
MPLGLIVLLAVAALIFFGAAHRVLDRLHLNDVQALVVVALLAAGSFVEIPFRRPPVELTVNVGGALVPLALVVYLLARADTGWERVRAILGAAVTGGALWGITQLTDFEPGFADVLDPLWLVGLVGGGVGYLAGRSRRASFVSATLGVLALDVIHLIRGLSAPGPVRVAVGGAGAFDAIVVAGILAVGLAEVVGEGLERLQGGPDTRHRRAPALFNDRGQPEDPGAAGSPRPGDRREGEEHP